MTSNVHLHINIFAIVLCTLDRKGLHLIQEDDVKPKSVWTDGGSISAPLNKHMNRIPASCFRNQFSYGVRSKAAKALQLQMLKHPSGSTLIPIIIGNLILIHYLLATYLPLHLNAHEINMVHNGTQVWFTKRVQLKEAIHFGACFSFTSADWSLLNTAEGLHKGNVAKISKGWGQKSN